MNRLAQRGRTGRGLPAALDHPEQRWCPVSSATWGEGSRPARDNERERGVCGEGTAPVGVDEDEEAWHLEDNDEDEAGHLGTSEAGHLGHEHTTWALTCADPHSQGSQHALTVGADIALAPEQFWQAAVKPSNQNC